MSFCLSFHLALPGLSGAHWLDDPPDVSCKNHTRQYAVDDPRLSCKQQVGGSSPPPAHRGVQLGAAWRAAAKAAASSRHHRITASSATTAAAPA